jgi:hypothetical protein
MARNLLGTAIHTMVTSCEMSAYAPSGAQKPSLAYPVLEGGKPVGLLASVIATSPIVWPKSARA